MRELKRYKEELAVIGLLSLVLLAVRWVSATIWPTTGQYDLAAETETVFWVALRLVLYTLIAWVALRVVAPKAYNFLKHDIVDGFADLNSEQKTTYSMRMYAIIFFGLMMLAMSGCTSAATWDQRTCVVDNADADVGVRELTGKNDGVEVERYLAHVGLGKGYPWCAAFVSYHLSSCGVPNPRSAWSPAFATAAKQVWTPRKASRSPLPGDVFTLYYPHLKRVGHVGFVARFDGKYITTIEGNTSGPGSREGDGVYSLKRSIKKVHAITSFIQDTPRTVGDRTTGAVRPGRMQNASEYAAHRDTTRQPDRALDSARYVHNGATGQRGTPCASSPRRAEHAACKGQQGQRYGGAFHRGWSGNRELQVRQPGVQDAVTGALPTGVIFSPGTQGRSAGGNTHTEVGLVDAWHGFASHALALVATAQTFHQTLLS